MWHQPFEEISSRFDHPTVKRDPEENKVELRVRAGDTPARVQLLELGHLVLDAKIDNRMGPLSLTRDHTKIPRPKDPDDAWADETKLRVFLQKGVFVEGAEYEIEEMLGTTRRLPPEVLALLLQEVERLRVSTLLALPDSIMIIPSPLFQDLRDPVQDLVDLIHLMRAVGEAMATGSGYHDIGEAALAGPGASGAPVRVQCAYCTTIFVHGPRVNCPNCGAGYTG